MVIDRNKPLKAYRIRHWHTKGVFEIKGSNARANGTLPWVAIPVKQDGRGYLRLMERDRSSSAYGCFHHLIAIAAKCPQRGILADQDGPYTIEDIALKSRCSTDAMTTALGHLMSDEIGWIDEVPYNEELRCAQVEHDWYTDQFPTDGRTERSVPSQISESDQSQTRLEGRSGQTQSRSGPSVFDGLTAADLADTGHLSDWLKRQSEAESPVVDEPSIEDFRRIVEAAEHALAHAKKSPVGLFVTIVSRGDFSKISKAAKQRADERVRTHCEGKS